MRFYNYFLRQQLKFPNLVTETFVEQQELKYDTFPGSKNSVELICPLNLCVCDIEWNLLWINPR